MMGLARKTLRYEWRRYLPAALAVAFAGVLVLVQAALVLGVFAGASVYVSASRGDLWVGYPGTQSVDLGRPIPAVAEMRARLDPDVARVEKMRWIEGDWRGPVERGGVSVYVTGIDTHDDALAFAHVLTASQRAALLEPGAAIVDIADLPKLGVAVGAQAEVNGHRVRIVDAARGLRALGGVNIVTSLENARRFDPAGTDQFDYLILALRDPARADAVAARLADDHGMDDHRSRRFEVWRSDAFAQRAVRFWLFDTGAGLGFLFGAVVVCVVGGVITSQTLVAAVAGNLREYATLRALGVGFGDLARVVLEQTLWIGGGGLVIALVVGTGLLGLARQFDVPVLVDTASAVVVCVLALVVAIGSGLVAMRSLRGADPILLLR